MNTKTINIDEWIEENKQHFLPPVCNKMMHGSQLKVFYVGGPNQRKDFHLEEGEELFYQKEGAMELIVLERGAFKTIRIGQGQVFLLPGKFMHSPQRSAGTIGLVIERERLLTESDCLRYYVDGTTESLFERWFYCDDLGTQLVPVIKEYFASEQHKTGRPIPGTIPENPPFHPDRERVLEDPFDLDGWLDKNRSEIGQSGFKYLFDPDSYQSQVAVYGPMEHDRDLKVENGENWIWILEGEVNVELDAGTLQMKKNDTLLVEKGRTLRLPTQPDQSYLFLSVVMDPNRKN